MHSIPVTFKHKRKSVNRIQQEFRKQVKIYIAILMIIFFPVKNCAVKKDKKKLKERSPS